MSHNELPSCVEPQELIWEIIPSRREIIEGRGRQIHGTLILDVDGTLTKPDDPYDIEEEAIDVLVNFLKGGGNLVFCTGATLGRIERTVLTPIYRKIKMAVGPEKANNLFENVIVMPENGSALLLNKEVSIEENELEFRWFRIHELHVPNKMKLRRVIEDDLMHLRTESYIGGDKPDDRGQRDYMLSWKNVCDLVSPQGSQQSTTRELVELINREVVPRHPEIDWKKISMKPARTTIDFVHADSGKTISVRWMLEEIAGLEGSVIGFGDLGDEFASVIPTINVNKKKPNEFRMRDFPTMDLQRWNLLEQNHFVMTGEGPKTMVRSALNDKEIPVLRDRNGEIIFATENENGLLSPVTAQGGCPIEIKPVTYLENGKTLEVEDAGKGSAWMIRRLIEVGYFNASARSVSP